MEFPWKVFHPVESTVIGRIENKFLNSITKNTHPRRGTKFGKLSATFQSLNYHLLSTNNCRITIRSR
jgi:hypothetical protein